MPNLAVFSTSVEVFPGAASSENGVVRLLHVRGGVSRLLKSNPRRNRSSPRPWRCFFLHPDLSAATEVFSTSVEVFLKFNKSLNMTFGLLHVRGGVSIAPACVLYRRRSSPRPWRCF